MLFVNVLTADRIVREKQRIGTLVEQRGIEPLTSALRTAKKRFSWTTF